MRIVLKREECWGIQRIRWLIIAAAAPSMNHATGREDVIFWIGEHKGRRIGSAGRRAGDDWCAKGLQVVISGCVERLPVLGVQRTGQVHIRDRASRLEVCFGQDLQRLFKGGVQVGDPHRGVEAVSGGCAGKQRGTGRSCDWYIWRGHSWGSNGVNLRDRFGGDGRNGLLWKADGCLGGDLADGSVCGEDELQSLFLFEQVGNVILKGGFFILKLVSFSLKSISEFSSSVAAFCCCHLVSFTTDFFLFFLFWWNLFRSGSLVWNESFCSSDPHFGIRAWTQVIMLWSAVGGRHRWNHRLNHPLQVRAWRDRRDGWYERGTWHTQICEFRSLVDRVIRETIAARWRRAAPRRRVTVSVKVGKHHPVKSREAKPIQY